MVNRAVADHLEILRLTLRRRVWSRSRGIERVSHAHAFNWLLRNAVDQLWRLDARGLKEGRHDINDVVKLGADAAYVFDMAGPRDSHALPGSAEMRRHLLGPLERRIERPRPAHRHVRISFVRAPVFIMQQLQRFRNS